MGNRVLKETICTCEKLEAVSDFAEILFYRLIVNCDDFGRLDGNVRVIRGKAFPLRGEKLSIAAIEAALAELERVRLIETYRVKGKRYVWLCGWEKHQKLKYRKAVYPWKVEARE